MKGKIKIVKTGKGFGFILGEDRKSYFFHSSGVKNAIFDNLREKTQVQFTPTSTDKGLRAEEIEVL